jgi:hypothetical protein
VERCIAANALAAGSRADKSGRLEREALVTAQGTPLATAETASVFMRCLCLARAPFERSLEVRIEVARHFTRGCMDGVPWRVVRHGVLEDKPDVGGKGGHVRVRERSQR